MEKNSKNSETAQLGIGDISDRGRIIGNAIEPPLGLIPKRFHDVFFERVKEERLNKVRGAIARYYNAGLKINTEWIEEYNELVACVGKQNKANASF